MISSCYFPDRAIQNGFNITLDSPDINHAISKLFNKPRFIELGFETKYLFIKSQKIWLTFMVD